MNEHDYKSLKSAGREAGDVGVGDNPMVAILLLASYQIHFSQTCCMHCILICNQTRSLIYDVAEIIAVFGRKKVSTEDFERCGT